MTLRSLCDPSSPRRRNLLAACPALAVVLLAAAGVAIPMRRTRAEDRSYDGTGNNIASPLWGSAGTDYSREASGAHYADGISAPFVAGLPSARAVSNAIMSQGENSVLDARNLTAMIYTWGQFIDHDMDLRASGPPVAFNIPVPTGDPSFDPNGLGGQVIPMSRSAFDPLTGTSVANPAQQINTITSYLDASMVYGSNAARATWLRTGSGGLLKSTAAPTGALLPHNDGTQVVDGLMGPSTSTSLFVAGDTRVNEQVGITSIQTLLMREHNRQATLIGRANPLWTDEQIYQMARKMTSAEMSAITYNEFLPAMLGGAAMPAYTGYNVAFDPSISNAFAAVAFRTGHSMLDDDIERVGINGLTVPQGNLPLRNAFFNPSVVASFGIDPMMRGFTTRVEQSVDPLIVDDIRNFLFGPPGAGGMDLAAIDIQRGRDHGLADYNAMRQDFGLPKVTTFAQITSDAALQAQLQSLYGSVDNIDAFTGALAEDHLPGSSVGPLTSAMIADQFNRLRTGDRLFYLNDASLSAAQKTSAGAMTLAELIRRNTFVRNIQDNAFIAGTINPGSSWNLAGGGTWNAAANWTGPAQVPNGAGQTANFAASPTSASNVSLDAPITIGTVVLSTANSVTVTPGAGGSLTFDNLGSNAGVLITGGAHSVTASVGLTDSLTILYYGAASLNLSGNISESNVGRSLTLDGSSAGLTGAGVTTLGGANSFTGGVQVTQSQVNLNVTLGQGALGSIASASNNGAIVLGFTPSTANRFAIGDLGAIQGTSGQLGSLNTAFNLALTSGAMIVRQTPGGALPTGLGAGGNLYLGYSNGAAVTGANANITVGATSATPFKGIGIDRSGSYAWGTTADTLTLSGNADLVALGSSTLTVAAKVAGGAAADTLTKRGSGTVKLTNVANTFAANNMTIEGGTLQFAYSTNLNFAATTNFNIQSGGTLQFNDGFSATINGPVVNNGAIVKPAGPNQQLAFKGAALTGSGVILGQDTQLPNVPTSVIVAHSILFDNGQTNYVGGLAGFDPASSAIILAANGPNTAVHITGTWDGDGASQDSWLVVTNGAKVYIDSTAQLDTISDTGQLRSFRARGDGTGVVEFADGFVANQRDETPGVVEFYVWSPGNFRWITHDSTNFPDSNIEINQEDGGVWSVQSRAQFLEAGLTTSRSFTIETQSDLTLVRPAWFHSFDGTKTITKTGAGTFTVAGEWSIGSGATTRTQDTSLGTTFNITAGKFVSMTDMGVASTNAGANGVFGSPGLPDADDTVTTKFIYNVVVSNPGTSADFNASQHILSLKINSGATANLNKFTYGGNAATTMQTDLLAVDAGAGTLNIVAGNSATVRSGTGSFKLAAGSSLTVQGGGTLNVNGAQTHGAGATLNIAAGTLNLATDGGSNLSIVSAGALNLTATQHLASLTLSSGGAATPSKVDLFAGQANLMAGSTLNLEIGGKTASLYDQLLVTGQLSFGGTLAVSLINPGTYTPTSGDAFNLFDWGTKSSQFSTLAFPTLPGLLAWNTTKLYVDGTLSLYTLLAADFDADGDVDAVDLGIWKNGFNIPGPAAHSQGDANGDGLVNGADLLVWQQQLGMFQAPPAVPASAAVPEPAAAVLAALAVCGLARRRR